MRCCVTLTHTRTQNNNCFHYFLFFIASFSIHVRVHMQNGEHAPHIILELKSKHLDRIIVADLYLNTHLLPAEHFLSYQNANGGKNVKRFNKTNVDLCHYHVSANQMFSHFHFDEKYVFFFFRFSREKLEIIQNPKLPYRRVMAFMASFTTATKLILFIQRMMFNSTAII